MPQLVQLVKKSVLCNHVAQFSKKHFEAYTEKKLIIKLVLVFALQIYASSLYDYVVDTPHDLQWIHSQIGYLAKVMLFSTIILYLCLLLFWVCERKKLVLLVQSVYLYKLLTRNTGFFEEDHGGWCLSIFAFLWFIYIFISVIIFLFVYLWRKGRNHKICLLATVFVITFYLLYLQFSISYATANWRRGLQGIEIQNDLDKDYCSIPLGNTNMIDTLNGYLYFWKVFIGIEDECKPRSKFFKAAFHNYENAIRIQCKNTEATVYAIPRVDKVNLDFQQITYDWFPPAHIIALNRRMTTKHVV